MNFIWNVELRTTKTVREQINSFSKQNIYTKL